MRDKVRYICDDCGAADSFSSYKLARADGWAVSKDYKNCYCPKCAPAHRLGGASGKSCSNPRALSNGFTQLSIEDICK